MIYPGRGPVGYRELAGLLRDRIASGELRPGQRLPSETTLAQTHGVARMTAREALRMLRAEGLAAAVRGYGIVVREHVEPELVLVDAEDRISARPPSPHERDMYDVPEGVSMLVVTHPDGLQDLYPADRVVLAYRRDSSPD
ncbi:GntR family transcriptional regulator [Micromonospora fluostatini]|uniref:GntR family transcriptional regulator n=1 Tax=Micromonospora fluostatini TaxID=1629071 RepID=A0ABY2DM22_9ACTN|nr:GntR family transcriptional regulator [Micromonospora fluostatini]